MALTNKVPDHEAELYAQMIMTWHSAVNLSDLHHRFEGNHDALNRYQLAVQRFRESDLSNVEVQRSIAEEQISGSMEWAFGETVSKGLREHEPLPRTLGEIARRLREALSAIEKQDRKTVRFSTRDELLHDAREFYSSSSGEDDQGAAGLSFLLSCSLERARRPEAEVVLLSPEVLGAQQAPSGRPEDLLTELRSGSLEVEEVSGESAGEGNDNVFRKHPNS